MTNLSHSELEKLADIELENTLFSIKKILNERALEKLELERKSREGKVEPKYKNTIFYYRKISENYLEYFYTVGPYSWIYKLLTTELWSSYEEGFDQYIQSTYLEVGDQVRSTFVDYSVRKIDLLR